MRTIDEWKGVAKRIGGMTLLTGCKFSSIEKVGAGGQTSVLQDTCPQTVDRIGKSNELMYNPIRPNDITWNFEKFLIDRQVLISALFIAIMENGRVVLASASTLPPGLTEMSSSRSSNSCSPNPVKPYPGFRLPALKSNTCNCENSRFRKH